MRVFIRNYGAWRDCGFTRRKAAKLAFGIVRPSWMDRAEDYLVGFMGALVVCVFAAFFWAISMIVAWPAEARDLGQYSQVAPDTKAWFNALRSDRGLCCSFADGRTITDADTDIRGNHFWVRIDGEWIEVPDEALVKVPNRIGTPVVWPTPGPDGKTTIRCFLPGAGA